MRLITRPIRRHGSRRNELGSLKLLIELCPVTLAPSLFASEQLVEGVRPCELEVGDDMLAFRDSVPELLHLCG